MSSINCLTYQQDDEEAILSLMDLSNNNLAISINAVGIDDTDFDKGCRTLNELTEQGIISQDEQHRRKDLLLHFMEVQQSPRSEEKIIEKNNNIDESNPSKYAFIRLLNSIDNFFVNHCFECLRRSFLGNYDVD